MSRWVLTSERQPDKSGHYEVCRAKGGPLHGYFWNGSYWVTPGHNPTDAVYSWFELDEEDKKDRRLLQQPTAERGPYD